MSDSRINVTNEDYLKLKGLAENLGASCRNRYPHVRRFIEEMAKAIVTDSYALPKGVVTLRSQVTYTYIDTGRSGKAVVVFPAEVDESRDNVSILSPFGMALIGEQEGTIVKYIAPGGNYRLRIDKVELPISV